VSSWLGVHLKDDGALSNRDLLECARLAEQLGFSGVTVNEDVGHDSLALLAVAARDSERIALGTAVVNCYTRSAMQVAMGIATVDDLSGGRATLGISVGHHPWNDQYHGIPLESPLPRLREYVAFIRGVLSGDTYRHDGRVFRGVETRLGFRPRRSNLPIHVGGDRSAILKLAGEVADGAIMNVVDPEYVGTFAADRFFSSAEAVGRDPSALELTVIVTCCLTEDREEALARAKRAFLRRTSRNAKKLMDTRGPEAKREIAHLAELLAAGEAERAEKELSDDLVTGTIAIGRASELRAAIDRYYQAGATRVLLAASPLTKAHISELMHALAPSPTGAAAI
jgi:alkanesulfonate monooxygenase SsuD/methylene tetrahydromethanopterin reductase-like flavin-dependent oxidoreductase (luciferase family)